MYNYERVLVLGDIWEESSPIGFVVISGDFYSSSQKHDKYICCLQLSIITDETKGGGGEEQKKELSYFMAHAFKRQSNSYNVFWFTLTRAITAKQDPAAANGIKEPGGSSS